MNTDGHLNFHHSILSLHKTWAIRIAVLSQQLGHCQWNAFVAPWATPFLLECRPAKSLYFSFLHLQTVKKVSLIIWLLTKFDDHQPRSHLTQLVPSSPHQIPPREYTMRAQQCFLTRDPKRFVCDASCMTLRVWRSACDASRVTPRV